MHFIIRHPFSKRYSLPAFGFLAAMAGAAFAQEQVSLEELKRRYREDWVILSEQIPMSGGGPFAAAAAQLERENADLTHKVSKLVVRKSEADTMESRLRNRLAIEHAQDRIAEQEVHWFANHARQRMQRVEYYQQVFRHPVLDEAAVLYVGSPLCRRSAGALIPAGTMLANFTYPVPKSAEAGKTRQASMKHARLLAAPMPNPTTVYFVALRRFPPDAVDRGTFKVVDIAQPGKHRILQTFGKGEWVLYEWDLKTVLRVENGDCMAFVFLEEANIACDFTGQARFGTVPLDADGALRKNREFPYSDFTMLNQAGHQGLDEIGVCSMGFLGWTSTE